MKTVTYANEVELAEAGAAAVRAAEGDSFVLSKLLDRPEGWQTVMSAGSLRRIAADLGIAALGTEIDDRSLWVLTRTGESWEAEEWRR